MRIKSIAVSHVEAVANAEQDFLIAQVIDQLGWLQAKPNAL